MGIWRGIVAGAATIPRQKPPGSRRAAGRVASVAAGVAVGVAADPPGAGS